jgi:hypothetical protein
MNTEYLSWMQSIKGINLLTLSKERFFSDEEKKVEVNGVEPMTPCLQSRCSSQLSYTP